MPQVVSQNATHVPFGTVLKAKAPNESDFMFVKVIDVEGGKVLPASLSGKKVSDGVTADDIVANSIDPSYITVVGRLSTTDHKLMLCEEAGEPEYFGIFIQPDCKVCLFLIVSN